MKLRRRFVIKVIAAVTTTSLIVMSLMLYFDSGPYDVSVANSSIRNSNSGVSLQRLVNEEMQGIEPPTPKKTAKPRKKKIEKKHNRAKNETYPDSNHAAEIELTEKEYEDFLKNKQLPRPLSSQDNKPSMSNFISIDEIKSRFITNCVNLKVSPDPDDVRDPFLNLVEILEKEKSSMEKAGQRFKRKRITIQEVHEINLEKNITLMEQFHLGISDQDIYKENDLVVHNLLREMATNEIVHVEEKSGGTQLKLIVTYYDGSQAMVKPMRFDRDVETLPNHFYFSDYERHNSEIAAFHLDRILGFRRCPPIVGRKLNMTTEIYAVADDDLLKTFFISPAQNYCFHGHCSYYCDSGHAICGRPDNLEGSFAALLPPDQLSGRKTWKNPWRRSYHKRRKAKWETNDGYCDEVRRRSLYNDSKRLADLIDVSILDFLIGNMDRHHYETFKIFGNDSFILHLDHGRGFGKSKHDEISILAPLYQCCFIHVTTFEQLLKLQLSPMRLSALMRCSLYNDPLNPILTEGHLEALDRRLQIVLNVLNKCFEKKDSKQVLFYG